ncbi:MAG: hypothetical protein AB1806_17785 [Acidobacteriota bacterium]
MTVPAFSPLPLDFHARIPCDEAFGVVVAELAGRLARVAGFDERRCAVIGKEVGDAFARTLEGGRSPRELMELALRVTEDAYGATVTCGSSSLLSLNWPRPA